MAAEKTSKKFFFMPQSSLKRWSWQKYEGSPKIFIAEAGEKS
jgi:hypothetical protein